MKKIITLLILVLTFSVNAQQLAFPTAIGAGAYATGGRGGIVVHVTNLNDSGTGSLREALQMTVPRIIVFDVSGVINLNSVLGLGASNSNVTIAGQTAPEGGITIDGNRVYINNVDNLIARHIRFKGGATISNDSLTVNGDVTNHIFDHCSFAFGTDEAASWYGASDTDIFENVTIQKCLFGESSKGSILGVNADDLNLPVPSTDITGSFIKNLMYNTSYRFPNITGRLGRFDIVNNVIWRSSGRLSRGNGDYKLNHIGNYYNYTDFAVADDRVNLHRFGYIPEIYTVNNKIVTPNTGTSLATTAQMNADNKLSWRFFQDGGGYSYGDQLPSNYFTDTQFSLLGKSFTPITGDEAYLSVPQDVGCNARLNADGSVSDNTDVLDAEWIGNVVNGVFAPRMSTTTGYSVPAITSNSRPVGFYVSNSHIPEAFLKAQGLTGTSIIHNDIAPSGYTWLEEYINQVDGVTAAPQNPTKGEIAKKYKILIINE